MAHLVGGRFKDKDDAQHELRVHVVDHGDHQGHPDHVGDLGDLTDGGCDGEGLELKEVVLEVDVARLKVDVAVRAARDEHAHVAAPQEAVGEQVDLVAEVPVVLLVVVAVQDLPVLLRYDLDHLGEAR